MQSGYSRFLAALAQLNVATAFKQTLFTGVVIAVSLAVGLLIWSRRPAVSSSLSRPSSVRNQELKFVSSFKSAQLSGAVFCLIVWLLTPQAPSLILPVRVYKQQNLNF